MTSATADDVRRALTGVIDPEIRRPITDLDMVGDIVVESGHARVDIRLTIVGCPAADSIERDVDAAVRAVPGVAAAICSFVHVRNGPPDAVRIKRSIAPLFSGSNT